MNHVAPDFVPESEQDLVRAMADPVWRLHNLYKIMVKEDEDDEGLVLTFKPNRAQRRLMKRLHYRNLILKARQLGFTTFICILFLDYCLFTPNVRAGIIAHTDDAAKTIFRDKVKFAYDRLPPAIKEAMPLARDSASELMFANNSSIRVSTSMRSGTIHFLHVSEFGKICARFPHRAKEVVTGSIPAVPQNGIIFIESTAEGRDGEFFRMSQRAQALHDARKKLTKKDYRFHFYAWWEADEYRMDPAGVVISPEDHEYFDELEAKIARRITPEQRAWYVATRDVDFSGNDQQMWQEYPSTPEEAFQRSTEGCYFTKQLTAARKQKRIVEHLPLLESVPCWTFWDIGNSDGTAIWVIQKVGQEYRCVRFYEAWGEPYSHAAAWIQSLGLVWDCHYLPHDADHVRQGQTANKSPREMLEELMPGHRFAVVDRIEDINWGIQQTRDVFPLLVFDETECKEGLIHIENYKRRWSEQQQTWMDKPDKTGGHSEAADALRQFAQAYAAGMLNVSRGAGKRKRATSWKVV